MNTIHINRFSTHGSRSNQNTHWSLFLLSARLLSTTTVTESAHLPQAEPAVAAARIDVENTVKTEAARLVTTSQPISYATFAERTPVIRKSQLAGTVKESITYRSEVVDANVTQLRRALMLLYNELNIRPFKWGDSNCYRRSFNSMLKAGLENISLAYQYAGMHALNIKILTTFTAFFKGCKPDWSSFVLSDRAQSLLTIFTLGSKKLGVETASVVTRNVMAAWSYGSQNVVIRTALASPGKLNLSVKRFNVASTNTTVKTVVELNGVKHSLDNVNVFDTKLALDRLLIPSDTSWSFLAKHIQITVNAFECTPKFKYTTHERLAVFNTRGEGNVLGYTAIEPSIPELGLVLGKNQYLLLAMMNTYGSAIITNDLLMSQWLRMFTADTMEVNGLAYELCNFEFSLTVQVSATETAEMHCLPFSIANYKAFMPSMDQSEMVASVLFAGVSLSPEFVGFDAFNSYPTADEVHNWRVSTVHRHWDHSIELAFIPSLNLDSTLCTPEAWADIMYLMYSYCGGFTPVMATPAVIEKPVMYAEKRFHDLYTSQNEFWIDLFVHDEAFKMLKEDTSPFISSTCIHDEAYPRLLYCVKRLPKDATMATSDKGLPSGGLR